MLTHRNRLARNPYFHFHPLHSLYALITVVILFGLLSWFAVTVR